MDDDLEVAVGQFLEALGRVFHPGLVVDKGEVAPVKRQEHVVGPFHRHRQVRAVHPVEREHRAVTRGGGEVLVDPQHDVGLGPVAFELEPGQKLGPVPHGDQVEGAVALRLEVFLDDRPRSPFGDEAVVGIDGERVLGTRGRRQSSKTRSDDGGFHVILHCDGRKSGRMTRCGAPDLTFPPPV